MLGESTIDGARDGVMKEERTFLICKQFFWVSSFFNNTITHGLINLHFPDERGLQIKGNKNKDFQLCFNFWWQLVKPKLTKFHKTY